jgi:hypothetical protein
MLQMLGSDGNWWRAEVPALYVIQELNGVKSPEGLVLYLFEHESESIKESHLKNIRTQEVIARMFLQCVKKRNGSGDANAKLIRILFKRLTDGQAIRQFLNQYCKPDESASSDFFVPAMKYVDDVRLFKRIACAKWRSRNTDELRIAKTALRRISDQNVVIGVAARAHLVAVRIAAVKRIDKQNQDVLCRIACSDKEPCVRVAAVERVDRVTRLDWIMQNDGSPSVRIAAMQRAKQIRARRKN